MNNKIDYLKVIAIVLVIIIIISASLILIRIWEGNRGVFPELKPHDGRVRYQGVEYELKENVESFLLLGLDKYEDAVSSDSHESGIQTDFVMVVVFNNDTKQCTAIQINRDTMTKVNMLSIGGTAVVDTLTKQVALAYNYVDDDNEKIKCGNTLDSVEYILKGVEIDHYFSMTMDGVIKLNDLLGGVEVEVLDDFTGIDDTLIKGERVVLTGEQALRYVRARQGLEDSTNVARMERQKQYIKALREKLDSCIVEDETFTLNLIEEISEYVVYDVSEQKLQTLIEKFDDYEFLGIRTIEGETRSGEKFLEFYPDEDSVWKVVLDLFYDPIKSGRPRS